MDLMWLTSDMLEIGPCYNNIDFDIGIPEKSSNDFMMTGQIHAGAGAVYVPGTEFGGLIEYQQVKNTDESEKTKGWTWRGLLTQGIICPASGQDYYIVSGDAHSIMHTLLSGFLGGFFKVPQITSGINIQSYQFNRYCTILDGLTDMLGSVGAKMKIVAEKPAAGAAVQVTITAELVNTIGDKYTSDSPVSLTHTTNNMGINHLICLGQGELAERTRIDLYIDDEGNISSTQFYTGREERTAVYDYSAAEDTNVLTEYGKKRLLEVASKKSLALDDADVDGDIGDLVFGHMRGLSTTVPIIQKICTFSGGIWTFESKIEGVS